MITKFTFTGANDQTRTQEMIEISAEFPFAEWGILVSSSSWGTSRFPSPEWIEALSITAPGLPLSMHLCGKLVKDFMKGIDDGLKDIPEFHIAGMFDRVQLNTHGFSHKFESIGLINLLEKYHDKEFIFQFDNKNEHILRDVATQADNISTLFDLSHGAGVLPTSWPEPIEGIKCGYAGGLSPDNLMEQIALIDSKTRGKDVWIDIETHVRSEDDQTFDLNKVHLCCMILQQFNDSWRK